MAAEEKAALVDLIALIKLLRDLEEVFNIDRGFYITTQQLLEYRQRIQTLLEEIEAEELSGHE